ncbi:uncharacterized protein LOC127467540 isoform X2 [Manacus candei]|uniref:uncharacterized protein LOC127467540 isoform X2 n=1 Tax=Manacus candei TaxID=415023 RepID=UPI002226115D|nr:uncharacterized protein LOC127467540 isoform X2 [Manacus candei]XP_051635576.1 uncharacterized protein LOC127467540 isoform X2 [Manacus candei]XP_051635577.1 uncharacterized protein LOC127467540 isoform X2 [Manacus candei]XP_051635578.1 uncharacterized protein LOC127467540 isoform X2 [Manacus candei]XP_051635579.1 uncharacterized protein LOC127467540 isoform X2 [Manacus candei]
MPHAALSSTGKRKRFRGMRCAAAILSQQDCVRHFMSCRARGTNFRRRHIVIPSLISFTMHSVQARIYLTVQAVAARIGAAFAQCFVPGILRRARERERRQASWSSSEKEQEP